MVVIQAPKETFSLLDYFHNPLVIFDGRDVLLGLDGPGRRDVTVLRFEQAVTLRTLPINSEYLSQYKYRVKHFQPNEIFGAEETKEWELLDARFWVIPFNDLIVEIIFFGSVAVDPPKNATITVDQLIRAVQ